MKLGPAAGQPRVIGIFLSYSFGPVKIAFAELVRIQYIIYQYTLI